MVLCDPLFPGKIAEIQLEPGEVMFLKRGSWLASTAGVSLTPTVEDATILALNFAKKVGSLGGASEEDSDSVLLRAEAVSEANDPTVKSHRLFFNSFGSIFHKRLEEGETYSVDNENLLAWSSSGGRSTKLAGGLFNSVSTGEGVEYEFTGPCDVFVESSSKLKFLKTLSLSPDFVKGLLGTPQTTQHLKQLLSPISKY